MLRITHKCRAKQTQIQKDVKIDNTSEKEYRSKW